MDSKGYDRVIAALDEVRRSRYGPLDIMVIPKPEADEAVRWLTIIGRGRRFVPSLILNALGEAGLMETADTAHSPNLVCLRIIGITIETMTFEDMAAGRSDFPLLA